jgi:hypothetical protein
MALSSGPLTCGTCRFFRPDSDESNEGQCRRRAPWPRSVDTDDIKLDLAFVPYWPTLNAGEWCGEWAPPFAQ